jgi:hypothetical protein
MNDFSERLDAIEARVNAATAGPWMMYDGFGPADDGYHRVFYIGNQDLDHVVDTEAESPDVRVRKADAEFIAAARTDIPWLIEELRKAHEQLQDAQRMSAKRAALLAGQLRKPKGESS